MSDTQDLPIYNFYDYMKTIFIYSHVKTYLLDPTRQNYEYGFDLGLLIFSGVFIGIVGLKIAIILVYFLVIQAFTPFFQFIKLLCKSKFKIDYYSSLKNACNYLAKIIKRFFTFNFYLFHNNIISLLMAFNYLLFLISSFSFFIYNNNELEQSEKTETYMYYFYIHFESFLLTNLLYSSFYACRNMKIAVISALALFVLLNGLTVIGYFITERIEDVEGKFEHDYPQNVMNIIYNSVFLLLNGTCFINFVFYKPNGK